MFDFVQENKRLVQIIFALIVLPFALWGVSSYDKMGATSEGVASVNGSAISPQDFENALRFQQDKLRKQFGANFDPVLLDNPEMKRAVLDNLVTQRLLLDRARAAKLVETDERIAQVIGSIEAFQDNGKFNKTRYEEVLKSQNMTPLIFESRLRDEFVGQQMRDAYVQNGFAANSVVEHAIRLNQQQRVISVATIAFQPFMAQAKVDDAQVQQYYEKNQGEFQIQEQAKVEYVKLSVDGLLAKAEISKEEALKFYEEHQGDFSTAEERQAAHILISVAATAPQAEQDAAKDKATQLLQQVRQSPAKFATLAKANSQDPGSASKGGDLGYFARGMMVKPFEEAAFSLKAGEISELVKSDFGYHIIKLVAIKPARVLPFDEAREGIVNKLRQQKATDMFAALAEKFSNTVYEQSDTLKSAAELAGSKIEQSGWLSKGMSAPPPWTAKMLQAIFTDDVTKRKRNTAAIEVDVNTLVAARILEYKPAAVSALNDVKDAIRQKLMQNQARDLAVKQGKEALAQLQGGAKPALNWGAAQTITRSKPGTLDVSLTRQVFQADAAKLPQYAGAESTQGGYMVVRVDAIKEGEAVSDAVRARYAQELRKLTGEELLQAYLEDAKKQANIKIKLPNVAQP